MNQHEAIVYSIISLSGSIAMTLIALIMRKYCKDSKCSGYGIDVEVHNNSPRKQRPIDINREIEENKKNIDNIV